MLNGNNQRARQTATTHNSGGARPGIRQVDDRAYRDGYAQRPTTEVRTTPDKDRNFDFARHPEYRQPPAATAGLRNRNEYRQVYRQGFETGYNEGFRRYARQLSDQIPPRIDTRQGNTRRPAPGL